jgi:phospholipid/cholesterol/gamma-HCH transport system permease protein
MMSNWLAKIGEKTLKQFSGSAETAAVVWAVLREAARPRTWRRTVRGVLARQVLFTGVEAIRFISLIAVMVGLVVVVQTQLWLGRVGQSALLGPVLVMAIMREIGPLLVNFVVIGRSGTAIAAEMGAMRINGEVDILDSQGVDPFIYLVVPRVLGMAISVFCLTIVFVVVSFLSGYASGLLLGAMPGPFFLFVESVFRALTPADVMNLVVKTLIPGAVTAAICCVEGLSASQSLTQIPQVTTRSVMRSVGALVVISVVVSVFTYV